MKGRPGMYEWEPLLARLVQAIDVDVKTHDVQPNEIARAHACAQTLRAAAKVLTNIAAQIDGACYEAIPRGGTVVSGGKEWQRTAAVNRKQLNKDAAMRAVFDSRIVRITGEVVDETPVEKLLHVFPLGKPRVTAARERGLDINVFYEEVEFQEYSVKVVGDADEEGNDDDN